MRTNTKKRTSIGSGWYGRRSDRLTTADLKGISIRHVARATGMEPGRYAVPWLLEGRKAGLAAVSIATGSLTVNGEEARLQWLSLSATRLPVLLCPYCFRRRIILYWNPAGRRSKLACSTCLNLAWPVEREAPRRRAVRRAWRVFARLGRRRVTDAQLDAAGEVIAEDEERPSVWLARMQSIAGQRR